MIADAFALAIGGRSVFVGQLVDVAMKSLSAGVDDYSTGLMFSAPAQSATLRHPSRQ